MDEFFEGTYSLPEGSYLFIVYSVMGTDSLPLTDEENGVSVDMKDLVFNYGTLPPNLDTYPEKRKSLYGVDLSFD